MAPITKKVQPTQCWQGYRRDCLKKRTCTHCHEGEMVGELISKYTTEYGPPSPQLELRKPYTMRKRNESRELQELNSGSMKYSMRKRSHQSMEESESRISPVQHGRKKMRSPKKQNKCKQTYIQSIINKKISEDIQTKRQEKCTSKEERKNNTGRENSGQIEHQKITELVQEIINETISEVMNVETEEVIKESQGNQTDSIDTGNSLSCSYQDEVKVTLSNSTDQSGKENKEIDHVCALEASKIENPLSEEKDEQSNIIHETQLEQQQQQQDQPQKPQCETEVATDNHKQTSAKEYAKPDEITGETQVCNDPTKHVITMVSLLLVMMISLLIQIFRTKLPLM